MSTQTQKISIPDFGVPIARPALSASSYAARCDQTISKAGTDWVVVYADREHLANVAFLTGFEPRFEEAILLLGSNGDRVIVTGNENCSYASKTGLGAFDVVLAQSLSLMGQDRSQSPSLERVLRECGIGAGQTIGLVGWKYLDSTEWDGPEPAFFVPSYIVQVLQRIIGSGGQLADQTAILMHPTTGLRSVVDADEIAMLEWGASRASAAVWRILAGVSLGDSEFEAVSRMGYAGEPLSCHVMFASGNVSDGQIIGLCSPSARHLVAGDGVTTAVGYWGGLSARGGLLTDHDQDFITKAAGYFEGLRKWYETADIGVAGGEVYQAVESALAPYDLEPALNPGHLLSLDEWSNTPIRKGTDDPLSSGMPFQVDVIPVPMQDGQTLNCEDAVALADPALRAQLKQKHPQVYDRIVARRNFMRDQLGVELKPSILPLSSTPMCLAPCWLAPDRLLVAK